MHNIYKSKKERKPKMLQSPVNQQIFDATIIYIQHIDAIRKLSHEPQILHKIRRHSTFRSIFLCALLKIVILVSYSLLCCPVLLLHSALAREIALCKKNNKKKTSTKNRTK